MITFTERSLLGILTRCMDRLPLIIINFKYWWAFERDVQRVAITEKVSYEFPGRNETCVWQAANKILNHLDFVKIHHTPCAPSVHKEQNVRLFCGLIVTLSWLDLFPAHQASLWHQEGEVVGPRTLTGLCSLVFPALRDPCSLQEPWLTRFKNSLVYIVVFDTWIVLRWVRDWSQANNQNCSKQF